MDSIVLIPWYFEWYCFDSNIYWIVLYMHSIIYGVVSVCCVLIWLYYDLVMCKTCNLKHVLCSMHTFMPICIDNTALDSNVMMHCIGFYWLDSIMMHNINCMDGIVLLYCMDSAINIRSHYIGYDCMNNIVLQLVVF